MRILITGFGPFGDVVDNPSGRIAERLAAEGIPGHEIVAQVLPVSFTRAAREMEALLADGAFDLALLLGVAGKETEIRLERCAHNRDDARIPDCDGGSPHEAAIAAGGPDSYASPVSLDPLLAELIGAGVPARISESAGAYVCNHAYYTALHAIASRSIPTTCLFVHVPADERTFAGAPAGPGLPYDVQAAAARRILEALLR